MSKKEPSRLLFDRTKYLFLIGGLLITALGFILMIGGGSDNPNEFSYDLFNFQRLTLAPFLVLLGYGVQIYAILRKRNVMPGKQDGIAEG
jgi:hypothetical protein